jgi:hypothetical protein
VSEVHGSRARASEDDERGTGPARGTAPENGRANDDVGVPVAVDVAGRRNGRADAVTRLTVETLYEHLVDRDGLRHGGGGHRRDEQRREDGAGRCAIRTGHIS